MGYFIRRSGGDCAVIAVHANDREEVIASGLSTGEAEELCVGRIEALRDAAPELPLAAARPQPVATAEKKPRGRQLAFRF
jgi:hypothetical protein